MAREKKMPVLLIFEVTSQCGSVIVAYKSYKPQTFKLIALVLSNHCTNYFYLLRTYTVIKDFFSTLFRQVHTT